MWGFRITVAWLQQERVRGKESSYVHAHMHCVYPCVFLRATHTHMYTHNIHTDVACLPPCRWCWWCNIQSAAQPEMGSQRWESFPGEAKWIKVNRAELIWTGITWTELEWKESCSRSGHTAPLKGLEENVQADTYGGIIRMKSHCHSCTLSFCFYRAFLVDFFNVLCHIYFWWVTEIKPKILNMNLFYFVYLYLFFWSSYMRVPCTPGLSSWV